MYSEDPGTVGVYVLFVTIDPKSVLKNMELFIVFVHMSNIKRSGDVSMHSLHFQDFLEDDCRFLEFLLAMNDNSLMGDIKSDPNVKLCW